jgi:catechol 2,3-dioxygenase-like lactoylglutathione lyase family enzyme
MLKPKAFHHAAIRVTDVERARNFYINVLGFKQIPRPDVPSPGAWLSLGDTQVHLIHGPVAQYDSEPAMATRPHLAIVIDNFDQAGAELEKHGIKHRVIRGSVAGSVVLINDPDGNAIELRESF